MDEICNTESGQVRSGQVSELSHLHLEDRPVPVADGGAAATPKDTPEVDWLPAVATKVAWWRC